jgi:hypothetical protein
MPISITSKGGEHILFIELLAYKLILETWRENPNATRQQMGVWSQWSSDDGINQSALTQHEVETMKSYVQKHAPTTSRNPANAVAS